MTATWQSYLRENERLLVEMMHVDAHRGDVLSRASDEELLVIESHRELLAAWPEAPTEEWLRDAVPVIAAVADLMERRRRERTKGQAS